MTNPKVPSASIGTLVIALIIALVAGVLPFATLLAAYANHAEISYAKLAVQSIGVLLLAFAVGVTALRRARYSERGVR